MGVDDLSALGVGRSRRAVRRARRARSRQADRSVEAFGETSGRWLAQEPLAARKATWTYRARKFVRRQWRGVTSWRSRSGARRSAWLDTQSLTAARDGAIAEAARVTRLQRFLVNLFQGERRDPRMPIDSLRLATVVQKRRPRGEWPHQRSGDSGGVVHDPLGIVSEQMGELRSSRIRSTARRSSARPRETGRTTRRRFGEGFAGRGADSG